MVSEPISLEDRKTYFQKNYNYHDSFVKHIVWPKLNFSDAITLNDCLYKGNLNIENKMPHFYPLWGAAPLPAGPLHALHTEMN